MEITIYETVAYFKLLVHIPEVQIVLHNGFPQLDAQGSTLFECLLQQQWLQHGIYLLSNVFQQHLNRRHSQQPFRVEQCLCLLTACITRHRILNILKASSVLAIISYNDELQRHYSHFCLFCRDRQSFNAYITIPVIYHCYVLNKYICYSNSLHKLQIDALLTVS